ncbi:MAG: DegV family protein [Bacillota bacterium]
MKKSIAVVVDSTVYLPSVFIEENDIKVASLNVIDGEDTYKELEIDNDFVFDKMNQKHKLTTSQPSPTLFKNAYEACLEQGYEHVMVLTLSKGLSGTYQSALLAKNMIDTKDKITIFDTENAAYGNELLTFKLVELINEGKTVKDITQIMKTIIAKTSLYFTVENLYHLQKGGRLSKTQAFVGTVLRVKPVIKVVEGKLKLNHKERTHKKIYSYLLDQIKEDPHNDEGTLHVRIIERQAPEHAEILKQRIEETFDNAVITITDYIGPVFSIHIGDKGFGLAWFFA